MNLDDIKKNLNAIATSLMKNPKKQVDSSVVLLLTIASTLVLMIEKMNKGGQYDRQQYTSTTEEE